MAKTKVVVDPITRIEGHLRIETQTENGRITDPAGNPVAGNLFVIKGVGQFANLADRKMIQNQALQTVFGNHAVLQGLDGNHVPWCSTEHVFSVFSDALDMARLLV